MSTQAATTSATPASDPSRSAFGRTYWMLNTIEMFERLAYFGIRAVVPLYIMQANEPGGLHLSAVHKGMIYAWWAVFQSFLPIITGGIADRYGYKRVLAFSISMNVLGYVLMANLHSYAGFFAGILVLATGTAFFKPSLQGSLAQNLDKSNSSLGWGIFYWVVNVGAFAAPFVSTAILGKPHSLQGWQTLFYTCAGFTACNLLLLLTFKDVPSGASKTESPFQVLARTIANIFDPRLIVWLLIMSCFWLMMYQLWDLHPNFITDWVDSASIAQFMPAIWQEYGDRGLMQVPQQILLNLNAGLIILLIVPLSWAARKMRTLEAMLIGMTVATAGVLVAGLTGNGWILLLGIVFFSLGEMWTGPKKNEYLGLIAPPGKKGLYLGYVNIPVGVGVAFGSYIAGLVYDNYGEKATLALKELGTDSRLVARAARAVDWSDALHKLPDLMGIPRDQAFEELQEELGLDADALAGLLRDTFRHDAGQITNLALIDLARSEKYRAKVAQRQAQAAANRAVMPSGTSDASEVTALCADLRHLPEWLGRKRFEVLADVVDLANEGGGAEGRLGTAEVVETLWTRYGSDPGVLDNLALEYFAQATARLEHAVADRHYPNPVGDIPKELGIERTKSFIALSLALGVSREDFRERMSGVVADDDASRAYVYLAQQDHLRFVAVAQHAWPRDVGFLRALIEDDTAAMDAVRNAAGRSLSAAELAEKPSHIQAALKAKDWTRTPDQAAQLFGLNPHEAEAMAAAQIENAPLAVTKHLWDKYNPQYKVWIPFAAIGVVATIALGIFGQMAKRWKDMNA